MATAHFTYHEQEATAKVLCGCLGETRVKCGKTVWGEPKNPACCSCPPHCPATQNLMMRKSQLLLKINRAPASRAEREAEKV